MPKYFSPKYFSQQASAVAAALVFVALVGSACSEGETEVVVEEAEPAVEAPTTTEPPTTTDDGGQAVDRAGAVSALIEMVETSGGSGGFFSEDEVRCWAEAVVDTIGLEAFAEFGTSEGSAASAGDAIELGAENEAAVQQLWLPCIDSRERLRQMLAQGASVEIADCVAAAASDQLAYEVAVGPFLFDQGMSPETEAEYVQLLSDCGVDNLG